MIVNAGFDLQVIFDFLNGRIRLGKRLKIASTMNNIHLIDQPCLSNKSHSVIRAQHFIVLSYTLSCGTLVLMIDCDGRLDGGWRIPIPMEPGAQPVTGL